MRTVSSSVAIQGGRLPLASVRLSRPIPKDRIFDVMAELKKLRLEAPVHMGEVALSNILGLESDVLITKDVEKQ